MENRYNLAQTKKLISIVTPCFNEEENVEELYKQVKKICQDFPNYDFEHIFMYQGGSSDPETSLLAAKASAMAAMISCGTFFDSPGTSGRINMLFVRQALEHLRDAGLTVEANEMLQTVKNELHNAINPHTGEYLDEMFADILQLPEISTSVIDE